MNTNLSITTTMTMNITVKATIQTPDGSTASHSWSRNLSSQATTYTEVYDQSADSDNDNDSIASEEFGLALRYVPTDEYLVRPQTRRSRLRKWLGNRFKKISQW